MRSKKILIISKVYHPDISPRANRTTELAQEFARQGHNVTVLLPDLDEKLYRLYTEKTQVSFINLGRTKFKPINGDSLILRIVKRGLQLLFEYPEVELAYLIAVRLKKMNGFDLLISIAVPHPNHWGVAFARSKNKKLANVWIADNGDPYMGCKTDTFRKLFYFKFIEKYWCRSCSYISVPENSAIEGYYDEFHSKIKVIPQGFKLDEIRIPEYTKNKIPTFAYAGALALHFRNPLPLIEFLSSLDIDFKFILYNQNNIVEDYQSVLNDKLEIRRYIPRDELLPVLAGMDFLINFDNNTSVQVPSKLIDYSIVKRPVLNVGKVVDSEVVLQFLGGDYRNQMKFHDLENFNIRSVASRFLELIDN
jgi:hypothetical protein